MLFSKRRGETRQTNSKPKEKALSLPLERLAEETERPRRRVNALEYVVIAQTEETIRSIAMKSEENERGALTRLMKVKK